MLIRPARPEDARAIATIHVDPRQWRRSVGHHLWREAERTLKDSGFSEVTLWVLEENARAILFYKTMGFVVDHGRERTIERGGAHAGRDPNAQTAWRMTLNPVLVTGATGRVGREVVAELLNAGVPVRALTRRPASAALPEPVDVVAGDLTVPESLDAALRGVRSVFLLWTAPPATAAAVVERLARHAPRVVLLSSPHHTPHPFFQQPNPMARFHADLERLIAGAGVESTIVRPGMFASNARVWWAPQIRQGDVVRWPYGDAETAPIDERDIAAVVARALYQDGHAGGDYVLTGPEPLSHARQVGIIGDAIGRRIRFEEMSPDEFRRQVPGPAADVLLGAWRATLGHPAYVTSTVADITGTPARTFRQWAADHADAFR